jgi:hypothetical protein
MFQVEMAQEMVQEVVQEVVQEMSRVEMVVKASSKVCVHIHAAQYLPR